MIGPFIETSALLFCAIAGANATEIPVKTLNSGPDGVMVFDPACVKIQPADTVRFIPAAKGHNAESIKGMAPKGASTFKTVVGEESVIFDKPGLYGIKCGPLDIMGKVGLIQVGEKPENLEAAKVIQHGKLAAKRFEPPFEKVQ